MTTTVKDAKLIGTLTIKEARTARINSSYAAWWTDVTLIPGTYDLFLTDVDRVTARIPATIVHEANAPHFGGVPFGPSTQTRTGQETVYFWTMYAHALAGAMVGGKEIDDEVTLVEGVEARRFDFEHWLSCGDAMGFGYKKDETGARIVTHPHYRRWLDGWDDDGPVKGPARDAAYAETKACPESKMVPSHAHGFFANGERIIL